MNASPSRLLALALVLLIWALIYLPGLGSLEIKGEEGRRILPAVTMLQTGNYLVPQVGSDPYFSKPPLINWLVAASFKFFGKRNEWAARLPSALCVLAVALAFVTVARRSLGASGSLIGALVWMTNFGMIEKGRLIELEALYVSLCGLAIVCWLSWFLEKRNAWLTWIVPWIFLGLGWLAKGPLHLVFFYAVVLAVLWRTGEWRQLANGKHLLGILLMLGIFAAWAIPCLLMMQAGDVTHTWSRQFTGRLSGEDFQWSGWLMNIPRGLGYFLPWVLLLAFGKRRTSNIEHRTSKAEACTSMFGVGCSMFDVRRSLLFGIAISFVGVSLLPGSLPRYTMPLLVPAAWMIAMLLTDEEAELPPWTRRLPLFVSALACCAIAIYAFAVIPKLHRREKIRTIAAQINSAAPANEPLYAIDPDYQPFLFYVRDPIVYLAHVSEIPSEARYVLVQREKEGQALAGGQWQPRKARAVLRLKDYRNKEVTLLEIG